jgi:orotate phosphoribosyltransferase
VSLFNYGDFVLHSGRPARFLIDSEQLTSEDLEAIAQLAMPHLAAYRRVIGIPPGGLRLARAFEKGVSPGGQTLLVDDVWTTGQLMLGEADKLWHEGEHQCIGLVIFARSPTPWWVRPVFQVHFLD